jgi:signal transduction histidine kinase
LGLAAGAKLYIPGWAMASQAFSANSAPLPLWNAVLADRSPLFAYGLAVVTTGIGLGVDAALSGVLSSNRSFILLGTVALTAIAAGLGPGLLAAALATAGLYHFFWAPAAGQWDALGVAITFGPMVFMVAWGGGMIRVLYHDSLRKTVELKAAVDERNELLSILSEDFRTHLSTLKLNHNVLRIFIESLGSRVGDDFVRRFQLADRELSRLTTLIDNVVEASKSKSGRPIVNREEFDLSELAREIANALTAQVQQAKCALDTDLRPAVGKWDRFRLERLLLNLLGNAIEYAPGSQITLRTYSDGGRAKLVVEDHGPGMPEEKLHTLFQPPDHADHRTDKTAEMGLGLYVAKKIVDAHGGRIDVQSNVGVGSVFTVDLPLYDN